MSACSTHHPTPNISLYLTFLRSTQPQGPNFNFDNIDAEILKYEVASTVSEDEGKGLFQAFLNGVVLELDAPGYPDPLYERIHAIFLKSSHNPVSVNSMLCDYSWTSRSHVIDVCDRRLKESEQKLQASRKEREGIGDQLYSDELEMCQSAIQQMKALSERIDSYQNLSAMYQGCLSEAEKQFTFALAVGSYRADLVLLEPAGEVPHNAVSPHPLAPATNPTPSSGKPTTTTTSSSSKPSKKSAKVTASSSSKPSEKPAKTTVSPLSKPKTYSRPKPSEKPATGASNATSAPGPGAASLPVREGPKPRAVTTASGSSPGYRLRPVTSFSARKPTGDYASSQDSDIEPAETVTPAAGSGGSKRHAANDSVPVAPPAKKVRWEPAPASCDQEMDDEVVNEPMGDRRMDKNSGREEREAGHDNVGDRDDVTRTLLTTANRTTSIPSLLEYEIAALRSQFNMISADVATELALLRSLQAQEERRTGRPFGEYDSPHVPAVHFRVKLASFSLSGL